MTIDRQIRKLLEAERAASKRMVLQTDWCVQCTGPLDTEDITTCSTCRARNKEESQ